MEETLKKIGLSAKEARLYAILLRQGDMTAAALADAAHEKRANTYALLESLLQRGLVETAGDKTRRFRVASPSVLRSLVDSEQDRLREAEAALLSVLPQVRSQYSLMMNKPGVVHMAGTDGFLRLLDDMVRSNTEVLLIASNDLPTDRTDLRQFRERLQERKQAGVKTRAIFHQNEAAEQQREEFAERGMELRFLGQQEFKGEVAIYEDNVAFTVYDPALVVTVLTNALIATTMRTLFEELWEKAK